MKPHIIERLARLLEKQGSGWATDIRRERDRGDYGNAIYGMQILDLAKDALVGEGADKFLARLVDSGHAHVWEVVTRVRGAVAVGAHTDRQTAEALACIMALEALKKGESDA